MAWHYATYIDAVTAAGKQEYSLPMYINAQLPAFLERAGDYPSGGPHPAVLDIYHAAASNIDFYSPDIYWPEFEYWAGRYSSSSNALFIPEARLDAAPFNALYAYGAERAFGFCPFGMDGLRPVKDSDDPPLIAQVYEALESLGNLLPEAQKSGHTRAIVLHATSPRGTRTVSLSGYLFQAGLSRAWRTDTLEAEEGGLLLLESTPDEFLAIGAGLTVKITRDPDTDDRIAGIASIEEVTGSNAGWKVVARLNGDQTNQGRQLTLDSHHVRVYRVRLYAAAR
jgi:hypothetical protein